jgi:hypothetical protein
LRIAQRFYRPHRGSSTRPHAPSLENSGNSTLSMGASGSGKSTLMNILGGARRLHILLLQFLVESSLLSVMGGTAGIILGIVASRLLSVIAKWPTIVSPASVAGGFAFATAVGVFFGWYPARKAAQLDPIESLRYE